MTVAVERPRAGSRVLVAMVVCQLLVGTGFWAVLLASQGSATYHLAADPIYLSLLAIAWGLPSVVLSVPVGRLIDAHGPRVVGSVGSLGGVLATAGVAIGTGRSWLLVLVLVNGAGRALVQPAIDAAPSWVPEPIEQSTASVWLGFAGNLPFIIGPAVGALLLSAGGVGSVFSFNAAVCLVAGAVLWRTAIRTPTAGPTHVKRGEFSGGRAVWWPLGLNLAVWISYGCFTVLEILYVKDVLVAPIAVFALLQGVFGAGLMVTSSVITKVQSILLRRSILECTALCIAAAEVLYVGTRSIDVAVAGAFLWGVAAAVFGPACRTALLGALPVGQHGRAMALWRGSQSAGSLLPPLVIGFLIHWTGLGVQPMLIASAMLPALAAIAVLAGKAISGKAVSDRGT